MTGGRRDVLPSPLPAGDDRPDAVLGSTPDSTLAIWARIAERLGLAERELDELRHAGTAGGGGVERSRVASLEAQLASQQRLARLGTLAGGVLHEIRNPIAAARGFAQLLAQRSADDADAVRCAHHVIAALDEIEEIATNLMACSGDRPRSHELVDPTALVREAIDSAVRAPLARDAAPRWSVESHVLGTPFRGDHVQLRLALRNLIGNALQAVSDGGRVLVTAQREGDDVVLRVQDSGPGVPAHLRDRITEPFFTTRPVGMGLGLALARSIAELHGGRLEVSDRPAPLGGAEVVLRIPFETP